MLNELRAFCIRGYYVAVWFHVNRSGSCDPKAEGMLS